MTLIALANTQQLVNGTWHDAIALDDRDGHTMILIADPTRPARWWPIGTMRTTPTPELQEAELISRPTITQRIRDRWRKRKAS